jgi:hypothetical protein
MQVDFHDMRIEFSARKVGLGHASFWKLRYLGTIS